jgi:adenylyl- and sulfurtransferase ThiI
MPIERAKIHNRAVNVRRRAEFEMTTHRRDISRGFTVRELAQYIGKTGTYQIKDMRIDVEVLDAKVSYGQTRYLITPVSGEGSRWVQENLVLEND